MRALLALIHKELLCLSRDASALAALFLMPLLFIVIMSLALKDVYNPSMKAQRYALVVKDDSALAQAFAKAWIDKRGAPQTASYPTDRELRSGNIRYAIVIEEGFSNAVSLPNAPPRALVRLVVEPGMDAGLMRANYAEIAALVGALRAHALLERFLGLAPAGAESIERFVSAERVLVGERPTAVQHNVPAWMVFGMFFIVPAMANLFVQERAAGILARLKTIRVGSTLQVSAKALPYFFINAIQAAFMLAAGVWLMPLLGSDGLSLAAVNWSALIAMLAAVSCAAIGLALLVASLVRTHGQASAVGPLVNVLMAATGGIMVPTFVMPMFMQRIAGLSPMNWALEGLLDVLLRGAPLVGIGGHALKLIAFAVVTAALSLLFFRKRQSA